MAVDSLAKRYAHGGWKSLNRVGWMEYNENFNEVDSECFKARIPRLVS